MAYNKQVQTYNQRGEPAVIPKVGGRNIIPPADQGAHSNWSDKHQEEEYSEEEEPTVDERRQQVRYGRYRPKYQEKPMRPPKPDTQEIMGELEEIAEELKEDYGHFTRVNSTKVRAQIRGQFKTRLHGYWTLEK
jgi:hypothetical protein